MNYRLTKAIRNVVTLFFPPQCPFCGRVTESRFDGALCEDCRASFIEDYISVCPKCNSKSEFCRCAPDVKGEEWDHSPYTEISPLIFDGYYTGYDENSIVSNLVFRMKRKRNSGAKALFARMIAQRLSRELTLHGITPSDFTLTFIPRSETSRKEHDFDHMHTVAKRVAEMLGCSFSSLLIRKGGTVQKTLSASERAINAQNSIFIHPRKKKIISGAKLIVIDDVITTGSTMRTAVSKLSFAGADVIIPAAAMISVTNKKRPPIDGQK